MSDGDYLQIDTDGQQITLPIKVVPYLAEGCIGYPVGQVPILHFSMPASVRKVDAPVVMDMTADECVDVDNANYHGTQEV